MSDEGSNELAARPAAATFLAMSRSVERAFARSARRSLPGSAGVRLAATPVKALIVGAAAIGVVGCGGSSNSASTTQSATPPATQAQATSASTQSTSATGTTAAAASGITAAGTALAVGATATVPYSSSSVSQSSKPEFTLQVTVTAIEKGTLSDFNGIKLDSTQKAGTPFYVKAKMTNIGSGDAGKGGNPSINIEGVDSTGETQQSVTFLLGGFPRCESKEPPKPFSQGKSFETCLVFLVPGGITKAAYTGAAAYITNPVTWK